MRMINNGETAYLAVAVVLLLLLSLTLTVSASASGPDVLFVEYGSSRSPNTAQSDHPIRFKPITQYGSTRSRNTL